MLKVVNFLKQVYSTKQTDAGYDTYGYYRTSSDNEDVLRGVLLGYYFPHLSKTELDNLWEQSLDIRNDFELLVETNLPEYDPFNLSNEYLRVSELNRNKFLTYLNTL